MTCKLREAVAFRFSRPLSVVEASVACNRSLVIEMSCGSFGRHGIGAMLGLSHGKSFLNRCWMSTPIMWQFHKTLGGGMPVLCAANTDLLYNQLIL